MCFGCLRVSAIGFSTLPHIVGDDAGAGHRGMDAVPLVERVVAGHSLQQERHQRDVVGGRQRR